MLSSRDWFAAAGRFGRGGRASRRLRAGRGGPSGRRLLIEPLEQRQLLAFSPLGGELLVNTHTADDQRTWSETPQAVASDANGNFVVTWASFEQDGDLWGVYAQRYNTAGGKVGGEFRVNNTTTNQQLWSSVAMDADGDFVVTWTSDAQDGDGFGIFARRYNAAGVAQGNEFQVNTETDNDQRWSTVAMDAGGNFVVTWSSFGQDEATSSGVFAQRYNAAGTKVGGEFRVNTTIADTQYLSSVAMNAAGAFVITWTGGNEASGALDLFAQRYNASGVAQGGEINVNTTTTGTQFNSSIGIDDAADFVISWTSINQDSSGHGVYAQRFSSAGSKQGSEFRVNTETDGNQAFSSVGMNGDGAFVITWSSDEQDGADFGIFGQQYTAAGAADGGEFPINTTTLSRQWLSSVAMDEQGEFVVAWTSFAQDSNFYGVVAQRFGVAATFDLDVDASGEVDALTDGLLIMRHLLGFSGNALINGALAPDATRSTAAEIDAYLDQAFADGVLDVDDNGSTDALTDGLLVMRYELGFSGNALINGAVGPNANRSTAAAIDAYLDSLMPGAGGAGALAASSLAGSSLEADTAEAGVQATGGAAQAAALPGGAAQEGPSNQPDRVGDWVFAQAGAPLIGAPATGANQGGAVAERPVSSAAVDEPAPPILNTPGTSDLPSPAPVESPVGADSGDMLELLDAELTGVASGGLPG